MGAGGGGGQVEKLVWITLTPGAGREVGLDYFDPGGR